jgi:hypothetical protein
LQKDFEKSLSTNTEKMDKVFAGTFGTTKLKKKNPKGTISAAPHRNLPLLAEELSAAQLPRTGARRGARPLSPVS